MATLSEVAQQAASVRDLVWRGRTVDELPDDELELATATRELWQTASSLLLDGLDIPEAE